MRINIRELISIKGRQVTLEVYLPDRLGERTRMAFACTLRRQTNPEIH